MNKKVVPTKKYINENLFKKIQRSVPLACVDLVVLRKLRSDKSTWEVLLVKRSIYPEKGKWVLIGGRILRGETVAKTINRQAKRELGVRMRILSPWNEYHPSIVLSMPRADPQKHPITLSYPCRIIKGRINCSGPEFSETRWFDVNHLPKNIGFGKLHKTEIIKTVVLLKTLNI